MSFWADTLKAIVQTGSDTYKDGVRISSLLDDKAQKTGAFAGLLLTAALGFLKPTDLRALILAIGWEGTILMVSEVMVLATCSGICLAVMWVRGVPAPLNIDTQLALTADLLGLPDEQISEYNQNGFLYDQIEIWRVILAKQKAVNASKGSRLFIAQVLLGAAVLFTAILLVLLVATEYNHGPGLQ